MLREAIRHELNRPEGEIAEIPEQVSRVEKGLAEVLDILSRR